MHNAQDSGSEEPGLDRGRGKATAMTKETTTGDGSQRATGVGRKSGRKGEKDKEERRTTLQVASLNINGFGNLIRDHLDNKWSKIYRMMAEHRIAVLLLQETHLTEERSAGIHKMFAKKIKVFHSPHPEAPTQKEGVAIVLNARFIRTAEAKMKVVIPGRAIQVSVPCQGGDTKHILCIYAPTSDGTAERKRFFLNVCEFYETHPDCPKPHIMAGDFNNIEDALDRLPVSEGPDGSMPALDDLKMSLGLMLADGWRVTNPAKREYTFHRGSGEGATFSRLDRFYLTPEVFANARDWSICEAGVRTDHSLIMVQITPENAPTLGQGRPLFPVQLLKDKNLTKKIKQRGIDAIRELEICEAGGGRTEETNPQTILWKFKTDVMRLGRNREKQVVPKLLAEIRDRERALKQVHANRNLPERTQVAEAEKLTKQIRQLKQIRYKQQQMNARATHRLYGERPTKYWSKLHKECAPRDVISAFEKEGQRGVSGEKLYETDSVRMAAMARTHHMNVQRDGEGVRPAEQREEDIRTALNSLETKATRAQADELGAVITYEECALSLRFARNGTSPGLDGIPFELWKTLHARHVEDGRFTDRPNFDVVRLLTAAFEDMRVHGVDPRTPFAQGWIAPIYKEKGERTRVVNYRPITLLNTDYKLLTKTLAIRLADVAPKIIHKAQAGFVPGRKIYNHTQLARMMMTWSEANGADGAIIALDQEKAYDKIAHDYLWRVLKEFGIPETFVQLIRSLYGNAKTAVMINGILSKPYQIYRGVRQGDPLSCLLFDLAIEPLSAMIRRSEIIGFNIPRCEETLKAVLFADDTTVYLSSKDDFSTLQKVLDTWCSAAKARFNISKTEIIPIGSEAHRKEMAGTYRTTGTWKNYPLGVHVAQDGEAVRILGAFFGNGIDQVDVWTIVLNKIVAMRKPLMEVMARWREGNATVQGKRHVVQMIIGGMTQYLTTVQRMPEMIVKGLTKIIRGYLWNDRHTPPVAMEHVCLPVPQGGLGIIDLEARNEAIDIVWLRTYLDYGEDRPTWAFLADDLLANHVTKDRRPRQAELRINPFLQRWKPKARGLPSELQSMMNVAKKYNVRLEGLAFARNILHAMPMWDHAHADRIKLGRLSVPSKLITCLQENHKVVSVEDFTKLASILKDRGHQARATCKCVSCVCLKERVGCANPHLCGVRAREMLKTLPGKWDPQTRKPEDYEDKDMEELRNEELDKDLVPFDRRVTTNGNLGHAIRIFTETSATSDEEATTKVEEDGMRMTIATDGSCTENGERGAQAGAGVYVEGNHELNRSLRLPSYLVQSNQTGEIVATLLATNTAGARTRVTQETDSQTTKDSLTKWKQRHEDTGYILQKNAKLTRATIAALRMRKAHTLFRWVKGHSGHPRNEAADALAAIGAAKATGDTLDISILAPFQVTGAKLQSVTQKLAYRAIRARKDRLVMPRPRTVANLDRITCGIEAAYGVRLHEAAIWTSLRSRHVARQASQFIWMAIHDGYMIGTHWLRPNMPAEMQERATCAVCGECETMTHIILECEAIGQSTVWSLLKTTWSLTQMVWHEPSWGTAFGAACAVFKNKEGSRLPMTENLWCILCTEAVHLIWKLRCERVIQKEGASFTEAEVTNRFYAAIDSRLNLDRRTAARARGKKAYKPIDVENIWLPIIEQNDNLPAKWVTNSGVLVGIKRGR